MTFAVLLANFQLLQFFTSRQFSQLWGLIDFFTVFFDGCSLCIK